MSQLTIWRNRLRKFRDYPPAVVPFFKKYLFYNWVGDSYLPYYKDVTFLNYEETIESILTDGKSIVRFGDDVFDLLLGIGLYYNDWRQRYDPILAARLRDVLASRQAGLLVCFNPELILKNKAQFRAEGISWQHQFWTHSRVYLKDYIHKDMAYGSALSFQERYNKSLPYDQLIKHLAGKHLIIVASNTARFTGRQFGLTTDYVEGPKSDAWDQYADLYQQVLNYAEQYPKEQVLIMTSLGPTSKVMVYDLVARGYTAWDTGQFFDLALKKIT